MEPFERLDEMVAQADGLLRTREATAAGVSKPALAKYVELHGYERVAHGIYLAPDAWKDSMYLLGLRCPQAIFSHETALFLHNLTDREPSQYSITVKNGYNPSRLSAEGVKVFTIKKELYCLGLLKAETPFGHTVAVYDRERTICDIVRSRSVIETQTFQDALKQYVRGRNKNLSRLMEYAQAFHVHKIVQQYLEVLL